MELLILNNKYADLFQLNCLKSKTLFEFAHYQQDYLHKIPYKAMESVFYEYFFFIQLI